MMTTAISPILENLTDDPARRSAQILSLVLQGKAEMPKATIINKLGKDIVAKIQVSSKVMTIDGVRVSVNQFDLQHIADYYQGHILTQKLADDINRQADVRIKPQNQPWSNDKPVSMGRAYRVFDYNEIVTNAIGNKNGKLYTNEGKDWVLDMNLFLSGKNAKTGLEWKVTGTNHGWYRNNGDYINGDPIQSAGHMHDMYHTDYSQLARIVFKDVELSTDGGQTYQKTTFSKILESPEFYKLISYTKGVKDRHPGVPRLIKTIFANA